MGEKSENAKWSSCKMLCKFIPAYVWLRFWPPLPHAPGTQCWDHWYMNSGLRGVPRPQDVKSTLFRLGWGGRIANGSILTFFSHVWTPYWGRLWHERGRIAHGSILIFFSHLWTPYWGRLWHEGKGDPILGSSLKQRGVGINEFLGFGALGFLASWACRFEAENTWQWIV